MKRALPFALLLSIGTAHAQPAQQPESNEREATFSRPTLKTFSGSYLLYLPDRYTDQPQKKWPVLLYLHSSDARSQDLQKLKQEGLPYVVRTGTKLPFIVVAPLCPPDEWWDSHWSVENTNTLLDEILEKYQADPTRIYLTGWSMGGAGTWKLASSYPSRFAAIAPISGKSQTKYLPALKNTPIWAFHGAQDTTVPVAESQKLIDALKPLGNSAQLTIFPNTSHEAWRQTYTNPRLYDWFLEHKLSSVSP
ncbi:phospholipase [bacterium]|nr:MAG: phospholipase [bacterium]